MKLSTSYSPEPLRFTRLPEDVAERRSDEFLHLMRQRRSVRQFSGEPVSRRLVDNALRVAASAPSGANRQPWEFVVVEDPATKARIRVAADAKRRGRASLMSATRPT